MLGRRISPLPNVFWDLARSETVEQLPRVGHSCATKIVAVRASRSEDAEMLDRLSVITPLIHEEHISATCSVRG
jgi:hypothetical protein